MPVHVMVVLDLTGIRRVLMVGVRAVIVVARHTPDSSKQTSIT